MSLFQCNNLAIRRALPSTYRTMVLGRRTSFRVPIASKVKWALRGCRKHIQSTTKDWSRGGLFIRTRHPCSPGEVLSILMDLGGGCVRVEGIVVHRSDDGMGVRLDVAGARVV